MSIELLTTALMVGFLGGVHCVGMCGPLAGAFTFSLAPEIQRSTQGVAMMQLVYNLGRLTSYILLGGIAGLVGLLLIEAGELLSMQRWLLGLAGIWMVILAAWLMGWSALPARLEGLGAGWWSRLSQRWRAHFLPVQRVHQAYLMGVLWGWMPCGLVYSTLVLAMSAGSVWAGMSVMLAFGLGTLPNLLLVGASAFWLMRFKRNPWLIRVAAFGMASFGCWTLWQATYGSAWLGVS
jgi:sulfite exporter TauE/SafE